MPFKTTLEAAIAHLVAQGTITGAKDVMKDLELKSRGTISAYATGLIKISSKFKTAFENKYDIRLEDFEHLINGTTTQQPPFEQNSVTKQFIQHLDNLIKKGIARNHAEVVEKIGWDKTALSNVINGRRNIPYYVYTEFKTTYSIIDPELSTVAPPDNYKDKYIALLEEKAERYGLILSELIEMKHLLKEITQKL